MIQYQLLKITTDGSGDATVTETRRLTGRIVAVEWGIGTGAAGIDFTLTITDTPGGADRTILTVLNANANKTYYPSVLRQLATDGSDISGVYSEPIVSGLLKAVVAQGGATKTCYLVVYYE